MTKRTLAALALTAGLAIGTAGSAQAGSPPKSQLKCFGDGSTCTLVDSTGAVLEVAPGGYAGVYINGKRTSGKLLASVDYSFDWSGDISGGSPRFSIPIDENGDGVTDGFAFIDAANAGGVDGESGTVSTESATVPVYYAGVRYDNWDAFAAANPTWTIAKDIPFVIADAAGTVTVSNVAFWVSNVA